jgi:hypothetical protein
MVLGARIGQGWIDQHEANSKAKNVLFMCLSIPEFERISNLDMAHEICSTLKRDIMRALLMSKLDSLSHIVESTRILVVS